MGDGYRVFLSAALVAACAHTQEQPAATSEPAATQTGEPTGGGKMMMAKVLPRVQLYCQSTNRTAVEIYNRAIEAENAKALDQAERLYKRALELDPNFCDAMDNLGQVYRMLGDDASAIPLYEKSAQ